MRVALRNEQLKLVNLIIENETDEKSGESKYTAVGERTLRDLLGQEGEKMYGERWWAFVRKHHADPTPIVETLNDKHESLKTAMLDPARFKGLLMELVGPSSDTKRDTTKAMELITFVVDAGASPQEDPNWRPCRCSCRSCLSPTVTPIATCVPCPLHRWYSTRAVQIVPT